MQLLGMLLLLAMALFGQNGTDLFENKIRPVLATRCVACHSAALPVAQGGLQLDSVAGIERGGNSGPLLPDLLLRAISHTDKNLKMPPGKPLAPEVVADFRAWVAAGARMPVEAPKKPAAGAASKLWSLRAPLRSGLGIDAFVTAKLKEKGLNLSPEADRRTLVRRLYFDLTGLPPAADEVAAFERDGSRDAYERLVDRLLASPRYGERWGRHWLDVARYADSENDAVNTGQRYPWSYTYRDWVIRAMNEDLPYDKFLLYQLAADRVPGIEKRHLAALGFLSLGREFPKSFPETVDDRIDATMRGMMGFTVACARCHDHKYDPIPTRDYYSMYTVFSNIQVPRELPEIETRAAGERDRMFLERLAKIRKADADYRARRHAEMIAFFKTQEAEYRKAVEDTKKLSALEIEELVRERQLNSYVLARWRSGVQDPLNIPVSDFSLIYTEGDSNNTRDLRTRYNTMLVQYAYDCAPARAMAVEDVKDIKVGHVFIRGNASNLGVETPARFLSAIAGPDAAVVEQGSGRLEIAQAIVDAKNPLTARVMVNRVWMHHFGSGLVRTPSDFGFRGDAPTHPELLDALAVRFMEGGWSLKRLHREILLSATYRQSSADNEAARKVDPENLSLWRMNRRRLEVEALRDAMLTASGKLSLDMGGVPFPLMAQPAVGRRAVYGFIERGRIPGALAAFDFASPDQHAPMRFVTTVPQQALFFLNNAFVAEQAVELARRAKSIDAMYRFVFGRRPDAEEKAAGERFVQGETEEASQAAEASPWSYGMGSVFRPFEQFVNETWQNGRGKGFLRATGGEPGEEAVVRRWMSPVGGTIEIEGTLRHNQGAVPYGDGVRARVVSSRLGVLGTWKANGGTAEIKLKVEGVAPGETIDFVVDSNEDPERDGFQWSPTIKAGERSWSAKDGFRGPAAPKLDKWARYAQVLLESNEFAFVD